ncbi:MAG: YceG family protein [Candidatus Gastranaerophilales bacterium]|nr:YceG family protein [Candidatus Gastranaerophilales bacterium]
MFEHKALGSLDDFFVEYDKRREQGVYFYRICGYNDPIREFLVRYYEEARKTGVVIEGRIPNPNEKNLAYYEEIMGMQFQLSMNFLLSSLRKWLPRMNDLQRNNVAGAIYDTLENMRREGKNDNMLRNAFIKFMCWLYYKFERVVNQLGGNRIPKILYEGNISNYELKLLCILSGAGCDVVLLQYQGDAGYGALDPGSHFSRKLELPAMGDFPQDFSIKVLRRELEERMNVERLCGAPPKLQNCTNAWIEGKGLEDVQKPEQSRGQDERFFYNCFLRVEGVEDKLTYLNELYRFQQEITAAGRNLVIVESELPPPSNEEIGAIRRKQYKDTSQLIADLVANIIFAANMELQGILRKAFTDVVLEESRTLGGNLNRLTNRTIYLLCWLKRFQDMLFKKWKSPRIECFVYLGGCRNENEALFLRYLSRLPVDVVILTPDLHKKCCLRADNLYEVHYENSLQVAKFPRETADLQLSTAAYHAERELDTIMYQDSGMYRNQQYQRGISAVLQSIYEEIAILWDQEMKYRPNFDVKDSVVTMPVIYAKVCGVKDGLVKPYWVEIKKLLTPDTLLIKGAPYLRPEEPNPVRAFTTGFLKNGKLQKAKIKTHSCYTYGVLREEVQEHILDKLQLLLDRKLVKGIYENGTEYTVIATVLNLNKDILRMLQKFDFTKKNPKIIYINTTEAVLSLEDSILMAFLNLVGFDIVFFVPTGYQCVEKYMNSKGIEEHQIGEYVYDLTIPDFDTISIKSRQSWRERLFKRGE